MVQIQVTTFKSNQSNRYTAASNCCAGSGWAAKLLDRLGSGGGFEGGKVPSVSFGLPYNCCAGSGWAAKLLDRSSFGGGFEGGEGAIRQFRITI